MRAWQEDDSDSFFGIGNPADELLKPGFEEGVVGLDGVRLGAQ